MKPENMIILTLFTPYSTLNYDLKNGLIHSNDQLVF